MRYLLPVLFLALATHAAQAQREGPTSMPAEKERALAAIKKWRGFEGTWEGEMRYVAAPKKDWYEQRIPVKIVIKASEPRVFVRHGIKDWNELGTAYRILQPDELTLVIHAYGAGGVWTENNVVVLTRRTEHTGEVFVQRVVNNWAGEPLPGEDLVYGDTRSGSVARATGG